MTFETTKRRRLPSGKVQTPRVRIVANRAMVSRNPEIRSDREWVYVSLHAPEIQEDRIRYSISKRYLLVWADGSSHAHHQFVILPHPVEPHDHAFSFSNGVVDARIRIRRTVP